MFLLYIHIKCNRMYKIFHSICLPLFVGRNLNQSTFICITALGEMWKRGNQSPGHKVLHTDVTQNITWSRRPVLKIWLQWFMSQGWRSTSHISHHQKQWVQRGTVMRAVAILTKITLLSVFLLLHSNLCKNKHKDAKLSNNNLWSTRINLIDCIKCHFRIWVLNVLINQFPGSRSTKTGNQVRWRPRMGT